MELKFKLFLLLLIIIFPLIVLNIKYKKGRIRRFIEIIIFTILFLLSVKYDIILYYIYKIMSFILSIILMAWKINFVIGTLILLYILFNYIKKKTISDKLFYVGNILFTTGLFGFFYIVSSSVLTEKVLLDIFTGEKMKTGTNLLGISTFLSIILLELNVLLFIFKEKIKTSLLNILFIIGIFTSLITYFGYYLFR